MNQIIQVYYWLAGLFKNDPMSERSKRNLATVRPDLVRVIRRAWRDRGDLDFEVICGHRGEAARRYGECGHITDIAGIKEEGMNLIKTIIAAWERRRLRPVTDGPCRVLCKPGVRFKAFHAGVIRIIDCLDIYAHDLDTVLVITSANDGRHRKDSLHYQNKALDIRTTGGGPGAAGQMTRKEAERFAYWMRGGALDKDYDVVLEADHLHVEYDPKG